MKKRSEQAWRDLFAQQATSGLSAQQFCTTSGLCPRYFSLRKKQLNWNGSAPSPFIPIVSIQSSPVSVPQKLKAPVLVLHQGVCSLHFEVTPSPDWLAQLLRALV